TALDCCKRVAQFPQMRRLGKIRVSPELRAGQESADRFERKQRSEQLVLRESKRRTPRIQPPTLPELAHMTLKKSHYDRTAGVKLAAIDGDRESVQQLRELAAGEPADITVLEQELLGDTDCALDHPRNRD